MVDIKPSDYIIAIIIFTFVIMGVVGLMTAFSENDDNFIDQEEFYSFNSTFNKYSDLDTNVQALNNSLSTRAEEGSFGVLNSLIKVGWNTMTTLLTSFSFMADVFMGTTTMFGIPSWIPSIIIMLITTLVVFAIYSAIFQKDM